MSTETCTHEDFEARVDVQRLTDVEGGPVTAFVAEVSLHCAACSEPFCFRGVPLGLSHLAPTMSFDGTVLSAPIHPMSDPTVGIGSPGYSVRFTERFIEGASDGE